MAKEGFVHRLREGGLYRILTGYDLYISALIVIGIAWHTAGDLSKFDLKSIVTESVNFSSSLTAVIVAGIAIIVALSDPTFLKVIKKNNTFQNFLFTFEYTAILSIIVSVYGIYLQSFDFGNLGFLLFIWLFLYLVLAVSRIISQIVSLGVRRGDVSIIKELSEMIEESKEADQSSTMEEE